MGIVRRSPEENRRRRMERRRTQARQQARSHHEPIHPTSFCPTTPIQDWTSFFWYKRWNLLPIEKFTNKGLYFSMCFDYPNFAYRYTHFQSFSMGFGDKANPNTPHAIHLRQEAKEKYFLNQKIRFALKRLVSAYLMKSMKIKNETDPVTLEIPKQSVFLVDYSNRCKFQFEAKELLRDFQSRLLTHDDLFPTPLSLRNPLTNTNLTLGQTLSLVNQIYRFGHTHWTVECFRDADYKPQLFLRDNVRKLRLYALKDLMNTPSGVYFLLDFMEAQHDLFKKTFDERTYRWALETNKCHSMERIRSWKSLCYTFYEIELTEDDFFERHSKQKRLRPLLIELCSPCVELQLAKRSFRRCS
jgi:hypothetical protein